MKRLSNNIIDERINSYNISVMRMGNYVSNKIKINWKCSTCSYIWSARPNNILDMKNGCPMCSGKRRLNNNIIDSLIKNRNITRVSNYTGNNKHNMIWKCDMWSNVFTNNTNRILIGVGCPFCANNIKKDNNYIDNFIIKNNLNIKRIDEYININTKIKFLCIKTNKYFFQRPNAITYKKLTCPCCNIRNKKELHVFSLLENICKKYNLICERQIRINIHDYKYFIDFIISDINNKKIYVEYNGEQHYMCVYFKGKKILKNKIYSEKRFFQQIYKDNLKYDYFYNNKITFVELPFWLSDTEIIDIIETEIKNEYKS
jgi:hypothetical protein